MFKLIMKVVEIWSYLKEMQLVIIFLGIILLFEYVIMIISFS